MVTNGGLPAKPQDLAQQTGPANEANIPVFSSAWTLRLIRATRRHSLPTARVVSLSSPKSPKPVRQARP